MVEQCFSWSFHIMSMLPHGLQRGDVQGSPPLSYVASATVRGLMRSF